MQRLEALYETGARLPNQANWEGLTPELLHAFGGDRAKAMEWARIWGSVSPNTSVPRSTGESLSVLAHSLERPGLTLTNDAARDLSVTMAGSKVPNINRALAGQALGTPKVEAMAQLMMGQERIPIDVHALYSMAAKFEKLDQEYPGLRALMTSAEGLPLRGGLTDPQLYARVEDAMASALREIAPAHPVNESFATLWEGARAAKGLKPQGGPIDILRRKGLLEFAAMLDPERLKAALKTAGWTAPAIAAVVQATSASDGEQATRAAIMQRLQAGQGR
jgi:hypothetical protein